MKKINIAIDGPAGSGKSTTARLSAQKLGFTYIDTGAMYRAITLGCIKRNLPLSSNIIKDIIQTMEIDISMIDNVQHTFLNGNDVSDEIRLPIVTKYVSYVSSLDFVRSKLVDHQRTLAKDGNCILDGRDIGTVILPNADLKIFLIASIDKRAYRRMLELKEKNIEFTESEIKEQITKRDNYDSSRENSPLKQASDAIVIDTSDITIEEQVDLVVKLANGFLNKD